jgi:mercuric reductase
MASYDFDFIVLGSGAAGSIAAQLAAKGGKNVAIIEANQLGGESPLISDIPMAAMLQSARLYESAKQSGRFGIRGSTVGYNYPSINAWKKLAIKRTGVYSGEEMYTNEGITVVNGRGYFIDPHTVTVGSARFTAQNFLIATGAETVLPSTPGLANSGFLTYREALNLTRPPKSVAILGAGATGTELAWLFAVYGAKIYLIEAAPSVLPDDEPETSALVHQLFTEDYSMSVYTSASLQKVDTTGTKKKLLIQHGSRSQNILVDELIIATGKRAVVDIGLENAGVEYKEGLIAVNQHLRTSQRHIFAAGDAVNPIGLTNLAMYQSRTAAYNVLHPKAQRFADYRAVPRTIYTNPEIATVGESERQLQEQKIPYHHEIVPINVVAKANVADSSDGFVKVLAHANTKTLLGATIACPNASEVINELSLAIQNYLTAGQVANTVHTFPAWAEAVRVACSKLALK